MKAGALLSMADLLRSLTVPYDPETDVRTATPWIAHPDNVKSFFDTGMKSTTTVAIAGAKQGANFRLSLSNQNIKGVLPNTDLKKNTISFNGELAVTSKITVGASASYISNKSDNIAENGYNAGNPMQSVSQWFGRQVDMNVLKEKWNTTDPKTGLPFNWNHSYHNNPYWTLNKHDQLKKQGQDDWQCKFRPGSLPTGSHSGQQPELTGILKI